MNATAEQTAAATKQADKMISMGCKLPYEKVFEMMLKAEMKKGWQQMTKKDIAKAEARERAENVVLPKGFDFAEQMKENARKNLPSSMR